MNIINLGLNVKVKDNFMTLIPDQFYHKDIIDLIDNYIKEDNIKNFYDLSEDQVDDLVALCLKVQGPKEYECLTESEDLYLTIHYLATYAKTMRAEYALDLANTMLKNATSYMSDILASLYHERYNAYNFSVLEEMGLTQIVDDCGEARWVKYG